MQYCTSCKAEIPDGSRFCSGCGAAQIEEATQKPDSMQQCVKCGRQLKSNAKFCDLCGASVALSKYTQPSYVTKNMNTLPENLQYNIDTMQSTGPYNAPDNYRNGGPYNPNLATANYVPSNNHYKLPKKRSGIKVLFAVVILAILAFGVYKMNLVPGLGNAVDKGISALSDITGGSGNRLTQDDLNAEALPEYSDETLPSQVTVDTTAMESGIDQIEAAFKEKNIDKAVSLVHPESRERYKELFTKNSEKLEKISVLLESRKPLYQSESYAEYQVTDKGKKYTIIFQKVDGQWMLVSL